MKIAQLIIKNFRGIKESSILFPDHAVIVADNNIGKTTIFEALDLALGPERLSSSNPINEHDFYQGKYIYADPIELLEHNTQSTDLGIESINQTDKDKAKIKIDVILIDLDLNQRNLFNFMIEFWDSKNSHLLHESDPKSLDEDHITEAIRITFIGEYDKEEDDFIGKTYFTRSLSEEDKPISFTKSHKRTCGFLYLRSVRTGNRALSLDRGSLLDIILRLKEVRPLMWENILNQLKTLNVAAEAELGISPILESIEKSLKKYVPREWGSKPQLCVSNFTREHLRKIITPFMSTGDDEHIAPFYRQGTGTINMLVLAMLSEIADVKGNVIFAMEEPETAIPPYAQKRIIHEVCKISQQAIFTSHSPYVLEEFTPEKTIVLSKNEDIVSQQDIILENLKIKRYKQDFRLRFAEGLLARRVLVVEGATEVSAFSQVCRQLEEFSPDTYQSLESLGVCIIDAGGETDIPKIAGIFKKLEKQVFVLCDKQENEQNKKNIEAVCDKLYMHDEKGFENLILNNCSEDVLRKCGSQLLWSSDISWNDSSLEEMKKALRKLFTSKKGDAIIAEFLSHIDNIKEIPTWITESALDLKNHC